MTWLRSPLSLLVTGGLFAVALVVVTPPFCVPDEPIHFYRAYQVSEGVWVPYRVGAGEDAVVGGELPASLATVTAPAERVRFKPWLRLPPAVVTTGLALPLDAEDRRPIAFETTALYSTVAYAPQAVGIAFARALGGGPLHLLYAARLANLAVALALLFLALRTAPASRWALGLVAFAPMATFQMASVSPDALTHTSAFALLAMLLDLHDRTRPVDGRDVGRLVALVALMAACKQAYLVIAPLLLALPVERFGSRSRQLGTFAALVATGTLVLGTSAWAVRDVLVMPAWLGDVDPSAQLAWIAANPGGLLERLAEQAGLAGYHLRMALGLRLGWLDTPLPGWLSLAYVALLVGVALVDARPPGLTRLFRAGCVALALLGSTLICVASFVYSTEVGATPIFGIQGRYFLPFLPLLLAPMASLRVRAWVAGQPGANLLPLLVHAWLGVCAIVTWHGIVTRYHPG